MIIPPMPCDLQARLEALAQTTGKSVEECVVQALAEYVDGWEEYQRTLETLQAGEDRPALQAPPEELSLPILAASPPGANAY